MQQIYRMSVIAGLALAIGVMMVPGAAFADGHHNHHHHNSVRIQQHISQLNACDISDCSNSGSNSASVDVPHHGSNHISVSQGIDQANFCSNSDCSNNASNEANVG